MRGRTEVLKYLKRRHLKAQEDTSLISCATVSGVVSTKPGLIRYVDSFLPEIGLITTKSFQVERNEGNPEPIICEPAAGSFGNSVGLRNPGMEVALAELTELRRNHPLRAILNVSVSASTVEDFIILVKAFEDVADIIELNFSCPHAEHGYGATIGCSRQLSSMYMRGIREAVGPDFKALIFPKLTPNVESLTDIAVPLIASGADGLSLINTVGPEVHISSASNTPILQNNLGGAGGMSGRWVHERALEAVRQVREAVGDDIPIIGMGGVSDAQGIAAMIESGADVVGIGSAFAKVHQKDWGSYLSAMVGDCRRILEGKEASEAAAEYVDKDNTMSYTSYTVTGMTPVASDTMLITLDGTLEYEAGEFAFLWLPGVGEKPFSIARVDPLSFIVKRRGKVSSAICSLRVGDTLYVRGLYGAPVTVDETSKSILIAGGTGIAVLPPLVKNLTDRGVDVVVYHGVSDTSGCEPNSVTAPLRESVPFTCIADEGMIARVLNHIDSLEIDGASSSAYIVGPTPFLKRGAQILERKGILPCRIHLSLELMTMCGVGMCGECLCGDRLTCQWGTFVTYEYITKEAPDLL